VPDVLKTSVPGADTADAPATSADRPRQSGPFTDPRHRTRYILLVAALVLASVGSTLGILLWGNTAAPGSRAFELIVGMRVDALIVIAVVAFCQAFATVSFQTATGNRIITPSIMGFEALYTVIQTATVFFLGAAGLTFFAGGAQFFLQAGAMVLFATLLYTWLLSGRLGSIHIMLLVGVVIGGGLGALSSFMQRVMDPNEFDLLTARLFGNIGNADTEILVYVIPVVAVAGLAVWLRARRMNLVALGADVSNNLGLNHRREVMVSLFLVAVLMSMTTSLIGPMTFLGFLVATLAYSATDTYDHRLVLPVAFLIGYAILSTAYFVLRHVFYAQGAVTVIIELVGGLVFLFVVMRKGRL